MIAARTHLSTVTTLNNQIEQGAFHSVEFAVDGPHPIYQFKIWRSESRSMFVVVKADSAVLPKLKPGRVLTMTYYGSDAKFLKRIIETRIGTIDNRHEGRFEGHCTIDLFPVEQTAVNN